MPELPIGRFRKWLPLALLPVILQASLLAQQLPAKVATAADATASSIVHKVLDLLRLEYQVAP